MEEAGGGVNEHGASAEIKDDFSRGGESHRGEKYLVSLLEADSSEREVQSRGAGTDGDGVGSAGACSEVLLELLYARPGGEPSAAQDAHSGFDLFVADRSAMERQEGLGCLGCCGDSRGGHEELRRGRFRS